MNGVLVGDHGGLSATGRGEPACGHYELPALPRPAAPVRARPHPHRARLGRRHAECDPRRARCADGHATQILLPGALTCRRADSTEVIGHALAAKAAGAGFRTIATRLGRPPSTVRRWLRRAPERHAQWLYERAVERAVQIDRELLVRPAPQPTMLGHALNLLAGAALRYRERLGRTDPPWVLIGVFSHGYLLAPPLIS